MEIDRDELGGWICFNTDFRYFRSVRDRNSRVIVDIDEQGKVMNIEYLKPEWNKLEDKDLLLEVYEELKKGKKYFEESSDIFEMAMSKVAGKGGLMYPKCDRCAKMDDKGGYWECRFCHARKNKKKDGINEGTNS